jgi:hypothetical protein
MSTPATSVTPELLDELISHEQVNARWYWGWLYAGAASVAGLVVALVVFRSGMLRWEGLVGMAVGLVAPASAVAAFFHQREKICGLQLLRRHLQAVAQDTEECQRVATMAWGVVQKMLGE